MKSEEIIHYYNQYCLKVQRKINDTPAYQLITEIEEKYNTDEIQLTDGTKIWNLIRMNLSFQQQPAKVSSKSILSLAKEGIQPLHIPQNIPIYGFSSMESRKLHNGTYYDIYVDPLYDFFGDDFCVFEWPELTGYRRTYDRPIYSKHYVPLHIPIWTKTFWNLLINKTSNKQLFSLKDDTCLRDIIKYIATLSGENAQNLKNDIYNFISVFSEMKKFLYKMLKKHKPKSVFIRCGHGRFPMALSQVCKELGIPSIELQHGLITEYSPEYTRTTPSANKDCIPDYFFAYGNAFAQMVKNGHLFEREKVQVAGFPYLQSLPKEKIPHQQKTILITGQWTISNELKSFILQTSRLLTDYKILFKPHPYDPQDYMMKHVEIINKYEDVFRSYNQVDIHATVYSTSGLEAMAFGVPTIFIDIYELVKPTAYIIRTPEQFEYSVRNIQPVNFKEISKFYAPVSQNIFEQWI